jgi:SAM-dependent methyltransferase
MDADGTALRAYYERGRERDRLSSARGQLEFARTCEIVLRALPPAPALVADIGGGPGRYALWLASLGYQIEHRDLISLHVSQLMADAAGVPAIRTAVGDAREIDLPAASADAVLLCGPLYHLPDSGERSRALRESARILKPGGVLFAAAISRWAARIDGILTERIHHVYPETLRLIDEVERTGIFPPLHEGAFTSYSHRPGELRAELTAAGLEVTDLVNVEGPGYFLADLEDRMTDPAEREVVIEAARATERVPELSGIGPHLLATAIQRGRGAPG